MNIILASILFLLSPKPFCSCIPLGPIDDQQYNSYSLIFKGRALKDSVVGYERFITFSIDKYYKGVEKDQTLTLSTATESAMCGVNVPTGDEWLIFAYGDSKKYTISLCSRSKSLNPEVYKHNKKQIEGDLKYLEKHLKKQHK